MEIGKGEGRGYISLSMSKNKSTLRPEIAGAGLSVFPYSENTRCNDTEGRNQELYASGASVVWLQFMLYSGGAIYVVSASRRVSWEDALASQLQG